MAAPDFGQRRPPEPVSEGERPRLSKRSQTVSLVLLVGAGAAAWGLSRVDPSQREEDALIYQSEQDCAAAGVRSPEDCRSALQTAQALYPQIAPRYQTNADCEAHHAKGACVAGGTVAAAAAGYFIPVMAGYMIGRTAAQDLPVQPLFRHRPEEENQTSSSGSHGGGYCTSSGGRVWAASGGNASSARVASSVARSRETSARVVSRGGFGATGRSFASSSHSSGHATSGG